MDRMVQLMETAIQKAKRLIQGRQVAYVKVFDPQSPFTDEVLLDLAEFCRAHESTFHADPRIHAVLEGRREVWLRITNHLNLSTEELYRFHKIRNVKNNEGE